MATPGANLSYAVRHRIWSRILDRFGIKPAGRGRTTGPRVSATLLDQVGFAVKAGIPATNTAADAPTGVGDFCWDSTNNEVYRCTAYTNGTTFTWLKIT